MDISPEYIKMADCSEIQDYRKKSKSFQVGDFMANYYLGEKSKAILDEVLVFEITHHIKTRMLVVWLPRQDQIQEMLIKEKFGDFDAHWDICVEIPIQFVAKNPTLELSSMEQIWLSCYMLSIHKKKWDGKKWIK